MRYGRRGLFELLSASGLGSTIIAVYIYLFLSDKALANPDIAPWVLWILAAASVILTRWLFSSTSDERLISGPYLSGVRATSAVVLLAFFAVCVHLRGTSSYLYEKAATQFAQSDHDALDEITRYTLYLNAYTLSAIIAVVYGVCMIVSALAKGMRRLLA